MLIQVLWFGINLVAIVRLILKRMSKVLKNLWERL